MPLSWAAALASKPKVITLTRINVRIGSLRGALNFRSVPYDARRYRGSRNIAARGHGIA